ncbi:MAG: glutamate synthase subunit beta [Victivallaceae bacterium]|nr:glutamate synthase subunit beta [Victivallaceae bacterium]
MNELLNPYRPTDERLADFQEVEKLFGPEVLTDESCRCMNCGIPFCHGAGCPLGNVIPEMNAAFYAGNYRRAWEILSCTSFFPEFTSRVCPALCEGSCTHGINERPVAIRKIEKCVIETAFREGWVAPVLPASRNGKSVAVAGAGPAGLYAAEALNRLGYQVTCFDANRQPGGLLRCGIPDFKLQKQVIDRRIQIMKQEGIEFVGQTVVGKDISAAYLLRNFDALVLAIGTPAARDLPVPGRELDGVHLALEFLQGQNRVLAGELTGLPVSAKGKHVVIIGGGDTGSDCAGTALRQGAKSVMQIEIMPMPPQERSASTPWPQWPYLLRTSSSHLEGGKRRWNLATDRFTGESGHVTALEVHSVDWSFSPEGKPLKFVATPDSGETIKADLVLLAMGFTGVPAEGIVSELGLKQTARTAILSDPARKIYAVGDCANGASLVVRAMADARKVVAQLHGEMQ